MSTRTIDIVADWSGSGSWNKQTRSVSVEGRLSEPWPDSADITCCMKAIFRHLQICSIFPVSL